MAVKEPVIVALILIVSVSFVVYLGSDRGESQTEQTDAHSTVNSELFKGYREGYQLGYEEGKRDGAAASQSLKSLADPVVKPQKPDIFPTPYWLDPKDGPIGMGPKGFASAYDGEDQYASEVFFYGLRNGIIVESGALDGVALSTTALFEKHLNWTAVHIEGNPESFTRLTQNRPKSLNIQAVLCGEYRSVHFYPPNCTDGNVNPAVCCILEFAHPNFLKTWHPNRPPIETLPSVMCRPPLAVFEYLGLTRINFWVLDVEGAELMILKAMDFKNFQVDVMCIEADVHDKERNREIVRHMLANDYDLHGRVVNNLWFVRKGAITRSMPGTEKLKLRANASDPAIIAKYGI